MNNIPLIIFAKIPEAGKVKTRLQPQSTAEQAAQIAKVLLEMTVETAANNWSGKVVLSVWPNQTSDYIDSLVEKNQISLEYQAAGNLGEKMSTALSQHNWQAAILGSDVPHLDANNLKRAHQFLLDNKNVIGPSADGGYYLIGCSTPMPAIFDGPSWGESSVLASTLAIAQQQQIHFEQLAQQQDIDNWQDLQLARQYSNTLDQRLRTIFDD